MENLNLKTHIEELEKLYYSMMQYSKYLDEVLGKIDYILEPDQLVMIAKYLKIDYTVLIPFRTEKSANRNSLELQKDLSNAITDQEELDKSSKTILLDFLSSVESTEEQ